MPCQSSLLALISASSVQLSRWLSFEMRDALVCTVNDAKLTAGPDVKERYGIVMDIQDNDFRASRQLCWLQKSANVMRYSSNNVSPVMIR